MRGMPVPEVAVVIQRQPLPPLPGFVHETTASHTNSEGLFSHPTDAPENSLIVLEKPGFATVAYRAGAVPSKISLPPTMVIRGSVTDESGTSLPNVMIGPVRPPPQCDHGPKQAPHALVNPI
jgi:hypothetical protein